MRLRGSREEVVVVVVVVNRGEGRPEELYGPNLNKNSKGKGSCFLVSTHIEVF